MKFNVTVNKTALLNFLVGMSTCGLDTSKNLFKKNNRYSLTIEYLLFF